MSVTPPLFGDAAVADLRRRVKILEGICAVKSAPTPPTPPTEVAIAASRPTVRASADSGFKFGRKSRNELYGVIPIMCSVAERGLKLSTVDFMIYDGLRTEEEQRDYVKRGVSRTMNSKHLKQPDGFSHAFDGVPIGEGGVPIWDWEPIYHVTLAIDEAATQLGVADKIVWGGAWDRRLSDFGGDAAAYRKVCEDYVSRRRAAGQRSVFIDGPHFEWRG
jgi:peptidoglycan L-alanyl-D-glutamate endopeptidase CwlK